jgi:hypothetical protein
MFLLVFITSFASSCAAVWLTNRLLDVLPVGAAYFPNTPIQGLTYGELSATLIISLLFAYCAGLINGFLFGRRYIVLITIIATTLPLALLIGLAAATLGAGLIASPIVVAYGAAVVLGVKRATITNTCLLSKCFK